MTGGNLQEIIAQLKAEGREAGATEAIAVLRERGWHGAADLLEDHFKRPTARTRRVAGYKDREGNGT